MGVGGVEVPTGTIDHEFGKGAPRAIAAGLMSLQRRPFSLISYGYYHSTSQLTTAALSVGAGTMSSPIDRASLRIAPRCRRAPGATAAAVRSRALLP